MAQKHDHKKDKDAFESQIGSADPTLMPGGMQSPLGPNPNHTLGPAPTTQPSGPDNDMLKQLQDQVSEKSKDKNKSKDRDKDKDTLQASNGLTHAAGEAMAHWSESAGPNKAPMDSLTVADRERKMAKKKVDDADGAKGNDHDKDKGAKEQTVS